MFSAVKSTAATTESLPREEGHKESAIADRIPVTTQTAKKDGNSTGYNVTPIAHTLLGTNLLVLTAIGSPDSKHTILPSKNGSAETPFTNYTAPVGISFSNTETTHRQHTTYAAPPNYPSSSRPPGKGYFQAYQRPYGLTLRRPYYGSSRIVVYTNSGNVHRSSAKAGTNASSLNTAGIVSAAKPTVFQRPLWSIPWYPGHYYYPWYRGVMYPYPQATPIYPPPATHVTVPVYVNLGGVALPDIPVVVDGGGDFLPDNAATDDRPDKSPAITGNAQGPAKKTGPKTRHLQRK